MNKISELKKISMVAFTLLALSFSGKTFAKDSIRINLKQALEIALSDNPTVQVAENEIIIKKFTKRETIASMLPNITGSVSLSEAIELQKITVDFAPEPIAMGQKHTVGASFNMQLPIIAPQLWKTIQLNQTDIALSLEKARSSKIEMINQVKSSYYSLLLAQDAYTTLKVGYNNAELNAQNITHRFNQGLVSEYDKLVADVQFRNQKPAVVNGENAVRLATMQLKVLLGLDIYDPIIFSGELKEFEDTMFSDYLTLKSDTSLLNNSSLMQLDIQARQLVLAEKINKLGYAPQLGMNLSYGWQAMSNRFSDLNWFPGSTLGLSLTVPIFDGGQKYYKTKQNKVSMINLDLQRDNLIRQLELSVINSLNNIEKAVEQVVSNKESVHQAERAYEISRKRYEVGAGTLLELNNSETALTQSRLQYAQAIFDYLSARAQLEATIGNEVPA